MSKEQVRDNPGENQASASESIVEEGRVGFCLFLASDSTCQNYEQGSGQAGWGMYLEECMREQAKGTVGIEVRNHAIGGRSSKSFVTEGRLERLLEELEPGDYMLIQFGHNDSTVVRPERYTDPGTDFKDYLRQYVKGGRARGGQPILVTPVARLHYEEGRFLNDFEAYCQSIRQVAEELQVPLVDLMERSLTAYSSIGYEGMRECFMISVNGTDCTHFTHQGAKLAAGLVAQGLLELGVGRG